MSKEVGEIKNFPCEIKHFEWRIPDFFTIAEDKKYVHYDSPTFSVAETSWQLKLYLNWNHTYPATELVLINNTKREYLVEYYFGLKKCDGSIEQLRSGILKGNEVLNRNDEFKFIEKSVLLVQKSELVPSNVLTITCTLKLLTEKTHSSEQTALDATRRLMLIKLDTLSKNFKDLIANKESCDTTLNVQDKEYKAHRAVLIARSPVFAAMFLHETLEKQTGIVTISDCDPDSFEGFLEFLYTGKFEEPSTRSALYLYETSDKYEVQELKTFCVEYLMENLSVENVCDVAILADKYEEANLLSAAQDFFNKNLGEIFDSSQWDSLVKNNYRLSKILLKRMSSKMKAVD